MQRFSDAVITPAQYGLTPVAGATVGVYLQGTNTLAPIYAQNSDASQTQNPFTTDNYGNIDFYAPNGRYDIRVRQPGGPQVAMPDVQFWDPADADFETIVLDSIEVFPGDIEGDPEWAAIPRVGSDEVTDPLNAQALAISKRFVALTDTGAGVGAALIGRGVVAVDSIADLLALPGSARRGDLRYLVKGYYAGSDVGGGEFYYDPGRTSENDGGTVFDGFVREISDIVVRLDWFGVTGGDVGPALSAAAAVCNKMPYSILMLSESGNFSSADVVFENPVTVTAPTEITLKALGNVEFVFHFEESAGLHNVLIDMNDFRVTGGRAVWFEKPFSMRYSGVSNILGANSDFEQYAVGITPFNGEAEFYKCKFSNVRNLINAPGSSSMWAGFIFVYGDAQVLSGDGFTLNLIENTFDTCSTIYGPGFPDIEKADHLDADAVRIFYTNTDASTPQKSRLYAKDNKFFNCQKRLYKPNSTTCEIYGDYARDDVRGEFEPSMSHIIQLRGGSTATIVGGDYAVDILYYPVVWYEVDGEVEIRSCKFKNITTKPNNSRLFFLPPATILNKEDSVIMVYDVEMYGFDSLYQANDGHPFVDIDGIKSDVLRKIINYNHADSVGHRLRNARLEIKIENARANQDDYGIYDHGASASDKGCLYENVTIINRGRERSDSSFPHFLRTTFPGEVTLINFQVLATEPQFIGIDRVDLQGFAKLVIIGLTVRRMGITGSGSAYINSANVEDLGTASFSGTLVESNTQPWPGYFNAL